MDLRPCLAFILMLFGCQSLPAAVAERPMRVETFGSLLEGSTGPVVSLERVVPGPRTYAVGVLSERRGEITIVDDVVFHASPGGATARLELGDARAERAALLVAAQVPGWSEWRIEEEVPFERLDGYVEAVASSQGYDLSQPLPVLIDGRLREVRWQVNGASQSPHDGAGGSFTGTGALVGFFSRQPQGTSTQPGRRTHFHLVSGDGQVSGHVEGAVIPEGAVIRLPRRR